MIGWLSGTLLSKRPPALLIDVGGVGYEVEAPMSTFAALPEIGAPVTLFIHHLVREDAQLLYGFTHEQERELFRSLLKVNGVGAKVALAILSGMDGATLTQCIHEGDVASLTRLPGIGKKTAERLIVEMRDRLGPDTLPGTVSGVRAAPIAADPVSEAVSALIALGIKPQEASKRVAAIDTESLPIEEIVRLALRSMAN